MPTNAAMLEVIKTCLPRIQQTLGKERWLAFAERLRGHAASFQNVARESDLTRAVDELMRFLYEDEQISELLTDIDIESVDVSLLGHDRPSSLDHQAPREVIDTVNVAHRFYLLCRYPESVDLANIPDRFINLPESTTSASPVERTTGQDLAQAQLDQTE